MLQSRTVSLAKGGDNAFRMSDPAGAFHRATLMSSTIAPVVSCVTAQDTMPALGALVGITFSSTQPGAWDVAYGPDDAFPVPAIDGLSCTIYFTPSLVRAPRSVYVSAVCSNNGGASYSHCRVHPGMRGVLKVGSGAGWDYADLRAAIAAAGGLGGYAFVIKNQTILAANDAMHLYRSGYTASQPNLPPSGEYTVNTAGLDPVYTPVRLTTVMAETPFGVDFDGQGTRQRGIDLWGGTNLESYERTTMGWSTSGNVPAVNCRMIHLLGFVARRHTDSNIHLYHVDHIHLECCLGFDANQDGQPIRAANSTDILFENCWAFGRGRYKIGYYQCKRVQSRRQFMRVDQITSAASLTPQGRLVEYHIVDGNAQNIVEFDCDQDEFWNTTFQDSGMLTCAHTDFWDYGSNLRHRHFMSVNSKLELVQNDARGAGVSNDRTDYVFKDFTSWRCKPTAAGGIMADGPSVMERFTVFRQDNRTGLYCMFNYRKKQTLKKSCIYKFGYIENTNTPTGVGHLIYSENNTTPVAVEDSQIFDTGAAGERHGFETGTSITMTNVDKTTDPTTKGLRYPGRMTPGSDNDVNGVGANGFWRAEGIAGTFFGETGYLTETTVNWMGRSLHALVMPFFRSYTYTGPRRSGGTGTLLGDRGAARANTSLPDYIKSDLHRIVPFPDPPVCVKNGGVLHVNVPPFAPVIQAGLTRIDVYIDGSVAQQLAPDEHAALFAGLITGRTYRIYTVAVHSTLGTSDRSDIVEVVM